MDTVKKFYTFGKTQQCTVLQTEQAPPTRVRFVKQENRIVLEQGDDTFVVLNNGYLDFCMAALNAYVSFDEEMMGKNLEVTLTIKER